MQAQLEQIDRKETEVLGQAREIDLRVLHSLRTAVSGFAAVTRVGMEVLDMVGLSLDETTEAMINLVLSYAQQIALIATSTSVVNPAYGIALATVAATLQARAIQLQAEGNKDAKAQLDKARRLMTDVTQSLIIFTRSA